MNRRTDAGWVGLWLLVWAAVAGCTSERIPAGQCEFDSDCSSAPRCADHFCRAVCRADGDCPANHRCRAEACIPNSDGAPGCVRDSDCRAPLVCLDNVCRTQCRADYDCQATNPATRCDMGVCRLRCTPRLTDDCDGNEITGCEVRIDRDPNHCGACRTACPGGANARGVCTAGRCGVTCNEGFADCDMNAANGCETDLSSPRSCGACGMRCAEGQVCSAGVCASACEAPLVLCSGRCVNPDSDAMHCGTCGNACTAGAASEAVCMSGRCELRCTEMSRANCDGMSRNGCETTTATSTDHCGACGVRCIAGANAVATCMAGRCAIACQIGFADCDGDATNGCEVDTRSSAAHCGMCSNACTLPGATAVCVAGRCAVAACEAHRADCDMSASNGCEIDTRATAAHCGACGNACASGSFCSGGTCVRDCGTLAICAGACVDTMTSSMHCGACGRACTVANGVAGCAAGRCTLVRCNAGFGDCDGNADNGCETALAGSVTHCGTCGNVCPSRNGTPMCMGGRCSITCSPGFLDCDGNAVNGCETDVNSTASHCGACGRVCSLANATAACRAGVCAIATCSGGFGDCDGNAANGCETNLSGTAAHCGMCGRACSVRNATAACRSGACAVAACNAGFADCDENDENGCEVDLRSTVAHCGACGAACSLAHATPRCTAGACAIEVCEAGWGDCDARAVNGCETDTRTTTAHCGMCGRACAAGQVCSLGTCSNVCAPPTTFCAGRCVNLQNDTAHCGTCGTQCPARANATPTCTRGVCDYACNAGFGDCDGNAANGCETALATTVTHCGLCGVSCNGTNGTPSCSAGRCAITCDAGFGNCDGTLANGCETATTTTVAHCGACGRACSLANATPGCAAGACTVASCNTGFGNCDAMAANGCETNIITSVAHCGACGRACNATNGTPTCVGGACGIVCSVGFGDCDASAANGCETNLNTTVAHCGACGRACVLPNATAGCTAGTCAVASCNTGFADCDGIAPNGCEVNLNTSASHCGACGRACATGFFCSAGTCQRDCGTLTNCSNVCVNLQSDVANCGACARACMFANASSACTMGVCGIASCNFGFGNCDGVVANGCETNTLTSLMHCGTCGNMCSFANAAASCLRGTCTLGTCNTGFGNCDSVASNGCEANLNTSTMHCGACGMACTAPTNGMVACVAGTCRQSCNPGYYAIVLGASIMCVPIQPPRQLDPSSFGFATTRRPTFRWAHVSPTNGARLQVCTTRTCASVVLDVNATGTSYTPTADLPTGRLYWRLFGLIGTNQGATVSPVWTMHVSVRNAARDAAFGVTPDFNGDGFADFAVWDAFSSGEPVRVFNGSAAGLSTAATQSLLGPAGSGFGTSVAPAGDVNGDGYGDLIVGAPNLVTAYVYLGSATGLGTRITLTGAIRTGFGGAVSWAGDTDDDGYGDVIVGACSPAVCEGAAYVFHGTSTGVNTTAARRLVASGTTGFGSFVRGAGEVNNDEADDVVVGHSAGFVQFLGTATSGTSFSVTGLTDIDFAWDVNGDGYGDVAVVSSTRTTAVLSVLRTFQGLSTGLALASTVSVVVNGNARVAGLGDVNGDGFSDVAWSATEAWVRVHHGAAGGISNTPTFNRTPMGAEENFGWQLWHGGSVNGDAFWDLLYEYTTFTPCQRYIRSHHGASGGVLFTPATTIVMPSQCVG